MIPQKLRAVYLIYYI